LTSSREHSHGKRAIAPMIVFICAFELNRRAIVSDSIRYGRYFSTATGVQTRSRFENPLIPPESAGKAERRKRRGHQKGTSEREYVGRTEIEDVGGRRRGMLQSPRNSGWHGDGQSKSTGGHRKPSGKCWWR
jgi:hypothetical protein